MNKGHPQLRQERTRFGNILSTRNSIAFLTYYNYASADSQLMPELKHIPDHSKHEGLIFAIYQQTLRTQKRLLGSLKESRHIN
jgi:hypothetical protein